MSEGHEATAKARASVVEDLRPVNYVDVKVHHVRGLPATFLAESGPAPMFSEHPFRYEIDFALGPQKLSLTNGRLLAPIAPYRHYIAQASLPPVELNSKDHGSRGVPQELRLPARPMSATESHTSQSPHPNGGEGDGSSAHQQQDTAMLLWALTTDADAMEPKEEKKDTKPPPKAAKGAPAAAAVPAEAVKPVLPTANPPPCVGRMMLHEGLLREMEEKMEQSQPLSLLFRRVLRPGAPAEWEDSQEPRYQAHIQVPLELLKEPGSTSVTVTVPLTPLPVEPPKEDEKGKKKAPPKKAKGAIPALLMEELDANEPHPYSVAQTSVTLTLTFCQALTRLPQARPRPDLQPADLIPTRLRPPRRPVDASKAFAAEVASLTQRIVTEYREHVAGSGASLSPEEHRTSFLNYLHSSGQSQAYQQVLIPAVQSVVREKFIRQPNPSKEDLNRVTNELYTYLTDVMHSTIQKEFGGNQGGAAAAASRRANLIDGLSASERWKHRALEAEVMREFPLASRYHQERLGATSPDATGTDSLPTAWSEYAEFNLRVRDTLKAEQGYREALAIDFAHLPSLVGYGTVLLGSNRFKEAEVFLQSAVDLCPSVVTWGCVALLYDLLLLSLPDDPDSNTRRAEYTRESKYAITQASRDDGSAQMSVSDAYLKVAQHCVVLHQEDLANVCLAHCQPSSAVELLYGRLYTQSEQYEDAIECLRNLIKVPNLPNAQLNEARMLLGDALYELNQHHEAELVYSAALRDDTGCVTGPSSIRLGNMYVGLGKFRDALSAFLSGAQAWPCGLTWLGVGIAYYRLEDLLRAEQALNESNILNNLNPKTWGYIALLCLRQRREEEADQAFNQSVKLGLDDSALVTEIGVEQLRLGRATVAELCFRRALNMVEDVNTHMQLGRALCAQKRFQEAREEFVFVSKNSSSETQRARAEEQIALIPAL